MDLVNHTRFPSLLSRFGVSHDVMGSALVVRVSYDLTDAGLVTGTQQTWPVSAHPWACAHGPMEADDAFYKDGTDLFVFGHARAPGRRPVRHLSLRFEMGALRRDLVVFGRRVWLPARGEPMPGAPVPFVEMPLTMQHAFGGTAEWDGLQVPCADNPQGKGFFLEVEQALGNELPNIEDPSRLIRRWTDRPVPAGVGICPPSFSTRLSAGAEFGEQGGLTRINGRLFNAAFPEMIGQNVEPGDWVRLSGVRHQGDIAFRLPAVPVAFRLRLGDQPIVRTPAIDQVGIEVDARRVFITYRYPFRYVLHARQPRSAEVVPVSGASGP